MVAHHAYLAGETSRVALLERAGDAARQGFDDDAAVRWYRAALERGRQALSAGAGDELAQIRLALKLALVLRYRGEVVASETVLREALELAAARGDRWAEVQARRGLARLASQWQQPRRRARAPDAGVAGVAGRRRRGDAGRAVPRAVGGPGATGRHAERRSASCGKG